MQKVLSTQTPAQIKKHAECFFKQNLKKNSAANKRYRDSLSPDDKVWILTNDAAAHQKQRESLSPEQKAQNLTNHAAEQKKYRESLSPEQKAQIQSIDTAAHKKQYELLPPEKKARRVETITKQRHEHLTEEEKNILAQIRSVAATLYDKVDLGKPTH